MNSSLRIKPNGKLWDLTGNTVVKGMDDTEMLFRIVTMTADECSEFACDLNNEELHNIVLKIREHREEARKVQGLADDQPVGVTQYVVKKYTTRRGWN